MSDNEPKFNLSEGTGERLGSLPCFTAVSSRGAAAKALESALEPLHRLVYGRPGVGGSRRKALEDFKGFPSAMKAEVEEKVGKLTKDRLRDIIKALGLAVFISQTHAEVAAGVVSFLMAPRDEGKIKDPKAVATAKKVKRGASSTSSASKKPAAAAKSEAPAEATKRRAPSAAAAEKKRDEEYAPAKKAKTESPVVVPASACGAAIFSDAEVQVEVYRQVLAMSHDERGVLGVKALRMKLEEHFKLPAGGLKAKKDIITTTASDCVRALQEAESWGAAALRQQEQQQPSMTASSPSASESNAESVPVEVKENNVHDGRHTTAAPVAAAVAEAAKEEAVTPAKAETSHAAPMHPGVTPA
jgi:hypothetical protein